MKTITVQLEDTLHDRLKAICSHHGELSYFIRKGIRLVVELREQENLILSNTKKGVSQNEPGIKT